MRWKIAMWAQRSEQIMHNKFCGLCPDTATASHIAHCYANFKICVECDVLSADGLAGSTSRCGHFCFL